ncbi:response regulator [Pseudoalteromonas luteoviolacea]|uniref:ATP-binding protein n=1 Tax=Pseudoalteromonas luteoviolacea TaxID=43657 RepID=UPI001B3A02BD|nr:ATP-binding protein [Pseudoalteromonas luteoviolacea]MBQ4879201.1 response regulator [Pseudoalteromonas luteoviolacea]MBQ4908261.1 response regulator [Pseudoalteromonas luteoviolacea]
MQTENVVPPRKAILSKLGVLILLTVIIATGWYVDRVNYKHLIEVQKNRTYEQVNVYRTRIEGQLAANIQLVRGLAIALGNEQTLTQEKFAKIAAPLFETDEVLRNLGAAPDMILKFIYPLEGNEKALGLNYRTHPTQRIEALQAQRTSEIVLAGPLKLLQGGDALIARVPVYDADRQFWGLLSVVIDMQKLYQNTQLSELEDSYQIAIRGQHARGTKGAYFYGTSDIQQLNPLTFEINVPSGSWVLYAAPRFGWSGEESALWPFRLALLTIVIIFMVAFVFFTRLLKQLEDQANSLTSMGSLAEVGAWSVELSSHHINWSTVTQQIFNVPPHYQPTWMGSTEFFKEGAQRKRFQDAMSLAIKNGKSFQGEFLIVPKDRSPCWVLIKAQTKTSGRKTLEVFGSIQNIHQRKTMEVEHEKVAKNNELLAQLSTHEAILNSHIDRAQELCIDTICQGVGATRASIWLFNDEQTHLYPACFSNTKKDSLQHYPPWRRTSQAALFNALISRHTIEAWSAKSHSVTRAINEQYLSPFEIDAIVFVPIFFKDTLYGALTAEFNTAYPQWTQSDKRFLKAIAAMLASLFSSQQQQQAQHQAVIEKELAEQSAKVKASFLASMSHEIRTPMNGILGMLNILNSSNLNDGQKRHVTLAQSSAESLLTIINDILDFSKIEAGKMSIDTVQCDLIQIISDCFAAFAPKAIDQHTELFLDSRNMQYQFANTDPHRLKQILNNLISNAIKFTENGKITLTCYTEQSNQNTRLWCSIEDTGIGISKAQLDKIFDSFTQADPSTTRKFGGTGLGLTIAKQLCELLGGALHAYSKLSVGSTFTFYIELQDAQPIKAIESTSDYLLIIDQHPQTELSARHMLNAWRVPTEHFLTIPDALEFCESQSNTHPALIVTATVLTQSSELISQALFSFIKKHQLHYAILCHTPDELAALPKVHECNTVLAPLTPATALALVQKQHTAQQESQNIHLNCSVLLVEDNKINQTVALSLLSKIGIKADCAANGRLAIEHLQKTEQPYDIILMDCQMPEMDGYTATQVIRQGKGGTHHKDTVIIALTANAMEGDEEKCLAAGMDAYLSKPIDFDLLTKSLQEWTSTTRKISLNSIE